MMNILTLVFILFGTLHCSFAMSKDFRNKVLAGRNKCKKEHNISDAALTDWVRQSKIPEGESGKCYLACYMNEMSYMVDGKLVLSNIHAANIEKYNDKEAVDKANSVESTCFNEVKSEGKSACSIASEYVTCKMRETKRVNLKTSRIGVNELKPK